MKTIKTILLSGMTSLAVTCTCQYGLEKRIEPITPVNEVLQQDCKNPYIKTLEYVREPIVRYYTI